MNNQNLLGTWIRRFLLEYMVTERNLSHNTQVSYRDTLVQLLPFASGLVRKPIDKMKVDDLSPAVIKLFLLNIEDDRNCSIATRNLRLSAIHSLARFIGRYSPEHIEWCSNVRSIPIKKKVISQVGYLEKPEMDALLVAPDRKTTLGERDYILLLFLYNSGARADEVARLTVDCLNLNEPASVRIYGKGNKIRLCPLWRKTALLLRSLISGCEVNDHVFRSRINKPMTRFGIHRIVTQYARIAAESISTIKDKRVSPHLIRHTTAVHLLRAGVDINTIRAWLGHVSLDTTNIYAEVDIEMKAKALACVDIPESISTLPYKENRPSLMMFLKKL
ncbi:tyrosine-type recombinase/integrase [Salmonella enterica]|uniref:tyrosine-type recombinase/integrase n=1 Tax=Salmonella enterica TaxID=28901 RepID=UPI00193E198E|nr:tyrosine-type recombinase/integrase [Salmonella enterica]EEH4118483.1 tyrosine-type recombinase/integrase [Salmonella enterica subsp. enterica serovar Hvittingfoss]EEN5589743.1 tyrosine-type recombinase/integrase [Salmonella enterica subsp. enterica serovar Mountpleasant]EIO3283218.1 tyrosine-type recombinase/integrase [Salmonella enterica]